VSRSETGLVGRARRYLGDAATGFERAPAEVTLALVLALSFSWAVEQSDDAMQAWVEIAVVCALGAAAAWTGTLLHALGRIDVRRRWGITLGGVLLAAVYGRFVLDLALVGEVWRAVMLVLGALLWVTALPAIGGGESRSDRFRRVNGRLLLRTMGVVLYGAALFAGLSLALGAIDSLFELNLDGKIYAHVWGAITFVLIPWVIVGGLPELTRPPADDEVAGAVHRLSAFLVPPLLAVYFAILYAYAVRIGVTGEVPKNLVSPLVLAAGALTGLAVLLYDPREGSPAGTRWLRLAPPLFLPLAALGVWTLGLRVDQYGWTEPRLLRLAVLLVLGGLAAGAAWQLARRRRFTIVAGPLALAAVLLLGAVGPWSAPAVARRDQQARLMRVLVDAGALNADGTLARPTDGETVVAAETYDRIQDLGTYIERHFGRDALPPALLAAGADEMHGRDIAASLGLLRAPDPQDMGTAIYAAYPQDAPLPLPDGRSAFVIELQRETPRGGGTLVQEGTLLRLRVNGEVLSADLAPMLEALVSGGAAEDGPDRRRGDVARPAPPGIRLPPELAAVGVTDAAGRPRGVLLVLSIGGERTPGGAGLELHRLGGTLILEPGAGGTAGAPAAPAAAGGLPRAAQTPRAPDSP
jgi:hypothetical protein